MLLSALCYWGTNIYFIFPAFLFIIKQYFVKCGFCSMNHFIELLSNDRMYLPGLKLLHMLCILLYFIMWKHWWIKWSCTRGRIKWLPGNLCRLYLIWKFLGYTWLILLQVSYETFVPLIKTICSLLKTSLWHLSKPLKDFPSMA